MTAADAPGKGKIVVAGEAVQAGSLRYALEQELGLSDIRVVCPMEAAEELFLPGDQRMGEEDDVFAGVPGSAETVVGDPLFGRAIQRRGGTPHPPPPRGLFRPHLSKGNPRSHGRPRDEMDTKGV